MPTTIEYRKHRQKRQPKYRLLTTHVIQTGIRGYAAQTPGKLVKLTKSGKLTILPGYWWDGPSGGVPDKGREMLWSLVHDALYDLLREGAVADPQAREAFRLASDKLMYEMMRAAGVSKHIAKKRYDGVRLAGEPFTQFRASNKVRSYTYEDVGDDALRYDEEHSEE